MQWSVGVEAQCDRVLSREEVVELADAVAGDGGIASGIGTDRYGAQLMVEADTREDAVGRGKEIFLAAAATAGLPEAPIIRAKAITEEEDDMDEGDLEDGTVQ
ncbi:MAG: hypothetical protein J2P26_13680 [Nocardiopsaceae bacterium]|nr:hypothetical protein [Nocardiopsaceae bacterium]